MTRSLRPVLSLLDAFARRCIARLVRWWSTQLCVFAPADMHVRLALRLASLERTK